MKKLIILAILLLPNISNADEYYLGRWVWNNSDPSEPYWEAPHKEILKGSLDLRSIPEQSKKGDVPPEGWAVFSYSQPINDVSLISLGNNLNADIPKKTITDLETDLKIKKIDSTTLKDVLWEVITVKADPTGLNGPKPLMPDKDLKMKLDVGDKEIKKITLIPYKSKEWDVVLKNIHQDYKQMVKTESYDLIAKNLDYLEKQYGIPYQTFIPDDSIQLASLPHHTTITESFNTSNGDILGPDLTWTELTGDTDILSNQAEGITLSPTFDISRADSDLSGSNTYAQVDIYRIYGSTTTDGTDIAGFVRKDSSATLTFYFGHAGKTDVERYRLYKEVSGTQTQLGSTLLEALPSIPFTIKTEANGSTITVYSNGVSKISQTDTAISTGTRAGIYIFMRGSLPGGSEALVDNFQAADLTSSGFSLFNGIQNMNGINVN